MAWEYSPSNIKNKLEQMQTQYNGYITQANQPYNDLQNQISERYGALTDFSSPFYAQYRKYLQSAIPKLGTNALLAPLMAGNVDYGTAQKLGSQRAQEMNLQNTEAINKGVQGFGLEMQSQANPLLGMKGNNMFNQQNYWENQRQFNEQLKQQKSENKSGFLNQLLGLGGGLGSMFLPGLFGGGASRAKSAYGG